VIDERARELRLLAGRCAAAHEATRVGGECDLVVIGAAAREGLTRGLPDGGSRRVRPARHPLSADGSIVPSATAARLLGVPLEPIIP
jgi:hypothetical protein